MVIGIDGCPVDSGINLGIISEKTGYDTDELEPDFELEADLGIDTVKQAEIFGEVREHFGDRVCEQIVPRSVRLSEAPSYGQPITIFDPTSTGAVAYRELAKEVLNE